MDWWRGSSRLDWRGFCWSEWYFVDESWYNKVWDHFYQLSLPGKGVQIPFGVTALERSRNLCLCGYVSRRRLHFCVVCCWLIVYENYNNLWFVYIIITIGWYCCWWIIIKWKFFPNILTLWWLLLSKQVSFSLM